MALIKIPINIMQRDEQFMQIQELIGAKRQMLLDKQKKLQVITKQNHFLDVIKNDYAQYYNYISQQKNDQIKSLEIFATKTIELNAERVFANFTSTQTGCVQDSVYFVTPPIAGARWLWNFSDGKILDATSSIIKPIKYSTIGIYPVTLKVISKNGCESDINSKNIEITPKPNASFTATINTCVNININFTENSSITNGTLKKSYWN